MSQVTATNRPTVDVPRQRSRPGLTTVVVGAGAAGRALVRDLIRVSSFGLQPVGYVDDDAACREPARPPQGTGHPRRARARARRHPRRGARGRDPLILGQRDAEARRRAMPCGVAVRHLPPFLAALQREIAGTDMRRFRCDR